MSQDGSLYILLFAGMLIISIYSEITSSTYYPAISEVVIPISLTVTICVLVAFFFNFRRSEDYSESRGQVMDGWSYGLATIIIAVYVFVTVISEVLSMAAADIQAADVTKCCAPLAISPSHGVLLMGILLLVAGNIWVLAQTQTDRWGGDDDN